MSVDKKKLIRRLKIVEGQARALQEMVAADAYCVDIITQTAAAKQALSGVEDTLLESHLSGCVVNQIRKGQDRRAVEEILKVYRLKRR